MQFKISAGVIRRKTGTRELSSERNLRFRIRRGDVEVELEGNEEYVRSKFEELLQQTSLEQIKDIKENLDQKLSISAAEELKGIIELSADGRPHLIVPVDSIKAKEAIGLILYAVNPRRLGDDELSELLSAGWKTTRAHVVRARASELRRDGKLIAEDGKYALSGAGVQWMKTEILPKIRPSH